MKRTIYIHNTNSYVIITTKMLEDLKSKEIYKFRINGLESIGRLYVRNKLYSKTGSIYKTGMFNISLNIVKFLKLKHMQQVEFELL